MNIYLIRHTKVNAPFGTIYGHTDIDLADTYKKEWQQAVNKVKHLKNYKLFSSPLTRCSNLAKEINTEFVTDKRIMELNFGDWEMKHLKDIPYKERENWFKNPGETKLPNGESFKELFDRVKDFFDELVKQDIKTAIIITHAGVINALICYILEIPLHKAFSFTIDNGSLTKIVKNEHVTFLRYMNR